VKPSVSRLEFATAFHVALLGAFSSWAFGGGVGWAVSAISVIGSFAPLLTLATLRERRAVGAPMSTALHALWPLLGFNALIVLGTLQPSLRIGFIEGGNVFVPRSDLSLWPNSARPELALKALWLFDAIVLSCFNLLIAIRHRRTLRTLLVVLAANILLLAVFGSVQKFCGATGLFFGRVASPNFSFFASFIYHNHWGAFAVLMLAVCLGLLFSLRPWSGYRDFWHSPALAAVVAIFFLAVTIPLSASRSCTVLAGLLLSAATLQGLRRVCQHHRERGKAIAAPAFALMLTIVLALAFLFFLSRETIETRVADTQNQFARMRAEGSIGNRASLYRDTWRMVCDRPWFGWGLGSYGTVFSFYNTQTSPVDKLPVFYADAHSDWLQLLAETGVTGTLLYLAFLLLPLRLIRCFSKISVLPHYLFAGCGLILLYASIEFPFGNPAVTLAFWTCYFCAVRWAQLDQSERAG
jgi:O-antigen ligase